MIETNPRRTCVLVLGMHRSGTSAITRMISLLGAGLPKTLMGANESNAAGHWEPSTLVDLDDAMLLAGGSAWNDWRPFDPAAALGAERLADFRARIQRGLEDQFEGQGLFVLKDPRVCRFTPLYLESLAALGAEVKVVLMSRRPLDVAGSLLARDRMPRDYALRLWLRHNLDAEAATRNVERVIISYDRAMNDPDAAIARLQELLAAAMPASADIDAARASLRRELRHHFEAAPACHPKGSPPEWAERVEAALADLERDGADDRATATLDVLRAEIDDDARRNGDALAYSLGDALRIRAELEDVTLQRNAMIARARQLENELQALGDAFTARRRRHVVDLASTKRGSAGGELPKQLSPWRTLNGEKRERIRRLREDYLILRGSPLFDADHYLKAYRDVVERGWEPILHYLAHGSSEGRWPSACVDPIECKAFFPELGEGEGNLVLRLIALHAPKVSAH